MNHFLLVSSHAYSSPTITMSGSGSRLWAPTSWVAWAGLNLDLSTSTLNALPIGRLAKSVSKEIDHDDINYEPLNQSNDGHEVQVSLRVALILLPRHAGHWVSILICQHQSTLNALTIGRFALSVANLLKKCPIASIFVQWMEPGKWASSTWTCWRWFRPSSGSSSPSSLTI